MVILNVLLSLLLAAASAQLLVFFWMWTFAEDKAQSFKTVYVNAWKKLGGMFRWFVAPVLDSKK